MPTISKRWTARQVGRYKPLVFLLSLYPVFRWLVLGFTQGMGANPAEFLIRSSGVWALVLLLVTLAVTPVRRLTGQPALVRLRRMLGLFSFFYTCLHVVAWGFWERNGSVVAMWSDFLQRDFIAVGVLAAVPMLALALTSTQGWMRRLGPRWQSLHRWVYVVAAWSVWHFWLMRAGKNDFFEPNTYGVLLIVLLLARLVRP